MILLVVIMLKVLIIYGSTREGRKGEPIAQWFLEGAKQRNGINVEFVDLRDWSLPFFNNPNSPATGKYDTRTKAWAEKIGSADAFVILTPEYNHGYPAVLKNALDYLYSEWNNKPIGFVSYGGWAGGGRAVQQLRHVAIELQMAPIRNQVVIPMFFQYFRNDGSFDGTNFEDSAENMLDQLIWWAKALKTARN